MEIREHGDWQEWADKHWHDQENEVWQEFPAHILWQRTHFENGFHFIRNGEQIVVDNAIVLCCLVCEEVHASIYNRIYAESRGGGKER